MPKKEMSLNFALDLLYQEATSEETKYSQKQKETAYNVLQDNLIVFNILDNLMHGDKLKVVFLLNIMLDTTKLNQGELEILCQWLKK